MDYSGSRKIPNSSFTTTVLDVIIPRYSPPTTSFSSKLKALTNANVFFKLNSRFPTVIFINFIGIIFFTNELEISS